ncbi:MAG: hypothetical protein JW959_06805 [Pirellulales bacterium]|nr:hypothetical protein [Pirellulales bacterium]
MTIRADSLDVSAKPHCLRFSVRDGRYRRMRVQKQAADASDINAERLAAVGR